LFNIRDFHQIHIDWKARERSHARIILAQQKRYSTSEQIRRPLRVVGELTAEEMRNRVEFLGRW
jgi:hypothetical protein